MRTDRVLDAMNASTAQMLRTAANTPAPTRAPEPRWRIALSVAGMILADVAAFVLTTAALAALFFGLAYVVRLGWEAGA